MKKAIIMVSILVGFSTMTNATTVQLDLFDIGCQRQYDQSIIPDSTYWRSDFDLGVTFTEITNVYMDWAGEITANLVVYDYDPENPFPLDAGVMAYLGKNPHPRHTEVYGGADTYPASELFDCISEVKSSGISTSWSDLLDGRGTIMVDYASQGRLFTSCVQYGSVVLDRAILVVEGTIVPEPSTILLFTLGMFVIRAKQQNK